MVHIFHYEYFHLKNNLWSHDIFNDMIDNMNHEFVCNSRRENFSTSALPLTSLSNRGHSVIWKSSYKSLI